MALASGARSPGHQAPRVKVGLLAVALQLVAGCGPRITEFPLDDLKYDYLFLVTYSGEATPLRIVDGTDDPAGLPGVVLVDGEDDAMVVAFTEEDLRAHVPGLLPGQRAEVSLRLDAPVDSPTFKSQIGDPVQEVWAPLPPGTLVHRRERVGAPFEALTLHDSLVASLLTLVVRVDPEFCRRPDQSPLMPFAGVANPLGPEGDDDVHLSDLAWVDDDTVLVGTFQRLALVRRGQSFTPGPRDGPSSVSNWLALADFGPVAPGLAISGFVLLEPDAAGTRTVVVFGGTGPRHDPDAVGWVRFAQLTADGLRWRDDLRLDAPRTVTDGAKDTNGDVVLGLEANAVLRWRVGTSTLTRDVVLETRNMPADEVFRLIATGNPRYPLVASTRGTIHTYSMQRGEWVARWIEQTRVLSPELYRPFGLASVVHGDDVEVWTSTHIGDVLWSPSAGVDIRPLSPRFPPRFTPCASATTDGILIYERRDVSDVVVQDGYAILAYSDCSALVQIRVSEPDATQPWCATLVAPGEQDASGQWVQALPAHVSKIEDFRKKLIARPGEAVVGTDQGGLYTTRW
ncbi:MAG: hypothetical protein KC933_13205 [Myxococcales bacterium]|nr:hypothetical protein [Myxococcales bacterium]